MKRLAFRQVSGKIARNIVCPIQVGDEFIQGQQFGMIKFGSTTELILPRPEDISLSTSQRAIVFGVVLLGVLL